MWALGCVLYEMCTLHVPFDAPNFTVLVTKILQGQYTPIQSHFGPVLEDLIKILLNVDPEKRPSSDQVLSIPALQPAVQAYLQRQKSLVGLIRTSLSGESPPASKNKIPRLQIISPQTPNAAKPLTTKRRESPMIESPTNMPPVQQKESPVAASRIRPASTGTPMLKKKPSLIHNLPGTPSTPVNAFGRKKSKFGDKVKNLRQSRITPPGSAEIRRAKLKKLDGATPKISNLVLRQRAVQSANCIKSNDLTDVVKSPAPKLSLFKHLFQRRAYSVDSGHLLHQESVPSPLTAVCSVSSEDEENMAMSTNTDNDQKPGPGNGMLQKQDSTCTGGENVHSGDSENDLDLGDKPGDTVTSSAPDDDQPTEESPKDPNNNLSKDMRDMNVSSSPKKQMKKMQTYTLLRERQMHANVMENGCLSGDNISEESEVLVPEVIKEVAGTLYQSACQMTGSPFTALETLRCYLETVWGTERFCEVYPKFREAVRNKIPFSDVSVEMSQSEWCLFPVLQQVYILETFNSDKIAAK